MFTQRDTLNDSPKWRCPRHTCIWLQCLILKSASSQVNIWLTAGPMFENTEVTFLPLHYPSAKGKWAFHKSSILSSTASKNPKALASSILHGAKWEKLCISEEHQWCWPLTKNWHSSTITPCSMRVTKRPTPKHTRLLSVQAWNRQQNCFQLLMALALILGQFWRGRYLGKSSCYSFCVFLFSSCQTLRNFW